MFDFNQEYVNEEVGTGKEIIKNSGCYELEIKEALFLEGQETKQSEGIRLKLESDLYKADVSIWYKKSNGELMKWNEVKLVQLVELTKTQTTFNNITIKSNNNGFTEKHLAALEGKFVGVFLDHKGEETSDYNGQTYTKQVYNVDGFYDLSTKRTTKEIAENSIAEIYDKMKAKYEKNNDKPKKAKTNNTSVASNNNNDDNEGFPF